MYADQTVADAAAADDGYEYYGSGLNDKHAAAAAAVELTN